MTELDLGFYVIKILVVLALRILLFIHNLTR